jgi:phosphoglycolate phosphatase
MDQTELQVKPVSATGFRWNQADAYLFDIDGTLLVARGAVHRDALHQAMREVYGVDTSIEGIAYHGKTDIGILRVALDRVGVSGATFEEKLPHALEVVCRDVAANASNIIADVCPSIPAVLADLRAQGKLLAVASGNLESVGWQKIEAAGLREFFSFGCFSDQHEARWEIFHNGVIQARKKLGAEASVCFVGDTPEDIQAAQRVKAHIIAVGTGIFSFQELASHGPDLCVCSCSELLNSAG